MSELKPITLYSSTGGPNPHKVVVIFEELSIPYKIHVTPMKDLHTPVYEQINPNGRVPAIDDPNTGVRLWESGAIIEYLVETYDKESKLTYTTSPEKYHVKQWLMFQMSGQGPYFGQAAWFQHFHPEKLPSAITRYKNEIKRVCAVRDKVLEGKQYLVGDKCTYADLSFVIWDHMTPMLFTEEDGVDFAKDYPHYYAWHKRLMERPAVKVAVADMMAKQQQQQQQKSQG